MKCTIPGPNARVLAKAVQSFARIGSELYIEAQPNGLSIRTVNRTKSAFAMILFHTDFFTSYDMTAASDIASANHCKISVKSCLSVFKNMRNVEECRMSMDAVRYKLKFEFSCRLEMKKTHHVCVLEQESLQAVFHADSMSNVLTAGHKLFEEIVGNFQTNEEELTLDASCAELVVKNFVEGATVDRRYMRSQMVIKPDEFESYKIGAATSITFSLRELRAILHFAEAHSLDMSVNFDTAGQPVVFCLRNAATFETNLVMSTLAPDIYDNTHLNQSTVAPPVRKATRKQQMPNHTTDSVDISTVNVSSHLDTETTMHTEEQSAATASSASSTPPKLFQFRQPTAKAAAPQASTSHRQTIARNECHSNSSQHVATPKGAHEEQRAMHAASLPTTVETDSLLNSEDVFVEFGLDSEAPLPAVARNNDDDVIPMSPPLADQSGRTKRRKMMKVFQPCFETTYDPRKAAGAAEVLAYGSDEEDARR